MCNWPESIRERARREGRIEGKTEARIEAVERMIRVNYTSRTGAEMSWFFYALKRCYFRTQNKKHYRK